MRKKEERERETKIDVIDVCMCGIHRTFKMTTTTAQKKTVNCLLLRLKNYFTFRVRLLCACLCTCQTHNNNFAIHFMSHFKCSLRDVAHIHRFLANQVWKSLHKRAEKEIFFSFWYAVQGVREKWKSVFFPNGNFECFFLHPLSNKKH